MDINTKLLISLQKLRMKNMQRTSAFAIAAVLSECGFHLHNCQSLAESFIVWTPRFVEGIMVNDDLVRGHLFHPYGARLIETNAGAVRCPAGYRLMQSLADTGRCLYDM